MKVLFSLLIFCFLSSSVFSQKKAVILDPPKMLKRSDISANDKWIENFKIKKIIFNVYAGKASKRLDSRQVKGDVYEMYKITFNKGKWSVKDFTKYATSNGKIIAEGSYKVENDILIITEKSFDYIGAFQGITQYTIDKYGYLKELSNSLTPINTDSLPDNYLKTPPVNSPKQ